LSTTTGFVSDRRRHHDDDRRQPCDAKATLSDTAGPWSIHIENFFDGFSLSKWRRMRVAVSTAINNKWQQRPKAKQQ
jgi:hypothetical protein